MRLNRFGQTTTKMRKPLLVIGAIILLVSIVFLMGGIYEEYFGVSVRVIYNDSVIFQEKCGISIWRIGMKERCGSYEELYKRTVSEGHSPVDALNFLSEGLGDKMKSLATSVEVKPINAEFSVQRTSPYFAYTKELEGQIVDFEKFATRVARALDMGTALLNTEPKQADITLADLQKITALRGRFDTSFVTSTLERKHNIQLALSSINGQKLEPNEEFSFNDVVGARQIERGYKSAKIISGGKFVEGIGGGVCQVSTTLYNAVLLSDLTVTYATRHSLPVSYVEPSRDAMVSSTNDFKFINSTEYPLYIFTKSENNRAVIEIYGQVNESVITLKSEIIKVVPFCNYATDGSRIDNMEGYRQLSRGKNGLISQLHLIKEGVSQKIRKDTYAPQHALWLKEEQDTIFSLPNMYFFNFSKEAD